MAAAEADPFSVVTARLKACPNTNLEPCQ